MAQRGSPGAAGGRGSHFCVEAEAALGVGRVHSTVWIRQTTELVEREGTLVRGASQRGKGREIGVSLAPPAKLRRLQEAIYTKAKQEPAYRFYLLYDKVHRADILAYAYALAKQNGGGAGCGRRDVREHRSSRAGAMAGRRRGGAAYGDVPPPTGAAGADTEAWRH